MPESPSAVAHRDFPGISENKKQPEASKEAGRYLQLSKEDPHTLAEAVRKNPKLEPLLKEILWVREFEHIRDLNPNRLSENKEAAVIQNKIYGFIGINPDTDRNPSKEKFIKGLIDSIVVENAELAMKVIETKWAILRDMIAMIFSWEGLRQIAGGLEKSVVELFSGDAYKTGKSLGELGLVTVGSGAGGFLLKKAGKTAIKAGEKMAAKAGAETALSSGLQAGGRGVETAGKIVQAPYNAVEAVTKNTASTLATGVGKGAEAIGKIPAVRKVAEPAQKAISEGKERLAAGIHKIVSSTKDRTKEVLAMAYMSVAAGSKEHPEGLIQKEAGNLSEKALHPKFWEIQKEIRKVLGEFPEIASVVEKYLLDEGHPTNLRKYLLNPETRETMLTSLHEIAKSQKFSVEEFQALAKKSLESDSSLMRLSDTEFSMLNGEKKSVLYSDALKKQNPELFSIAEDPTIRQMQLLEGYLGTLRTQGIETLAKTLDEIAWKRIGGFPEVNLRAKSAEGVLDKISRMRKGNGGKDPRPNYDLSAMPDALGGRITVRDIKDLERVMREIERRFGHAKIIERDNFYNNPSKAMKPYRAITYTVQVLVEGYPAEIQLTTLKASIVADLDHNVIYKPIIPATAKEKAAVEDLCRQATALELQAL